MSTTEPDETMEPDTDDDDDGEPDADDSGTTP